MGALDGLKVVDLSRLLPGAFCTTILADHGADVIVVEAPGFKDDKVLGEVPMVRRNKRHIALDLSTDEGKEIFFKLLPAADVLVESFRPGVARRLGIDYELLSASFPGLIYCSLSGYGQTGPLRDKAGHDLNYMAISGMLDLNRDKHGTPIAPNFQIAHMSGGLYAVIGILLALASRAKTGRGQYLDVSMTDGLLSLLAIPLSNTFSGKPFPGREGNNQHAQLPCYRVYQTRDRRHISVGPLEGHLWEKLCRKLGCPEYSGFQYDVDRRSEITARLEEVFSSRDLRRWLETLDESDDCVAPVNKMANLPNEPHFQERQMILMGPGGIPQPGIVPKLAKTPGEIRRSEYRFGEDTEAILAELGYEEQQIRRLINEGVVWSNKAGH